MVALGQTTNPKIELVEAWCSEGPCDGSNNVVCLGNEVASDVVVVMQLQVLGSELSCQALESALCFADVTPDKGQDHQVQEGAQGREEAGQGRKEGEASKQEGVEEEQQEQQGQQGQQEEAANKQASDARASHDQALRQSASESGLGGLSG